MATQACNLSCQGCTNYSDLPFNGHITWPHAKSWIEPWLNRISIDDFGIIGGEPMLNPEIDAWLYGLRDLLPTSQLRLTTNGLLIKSPSNLLNMLDNIGNIVFKITIHVDTPKLRNIIDEIFSLRLWKPVHEHGIDRWRLDNGVRFQINRPNQFLMTYRGTYENMMPHHSDPIRAFELCVQKTCPLLWHGRIFKCSTAGLLLNTLDKVQMRDRRQWQPFIDPGISPDSSEKDIETFIANFGKPNHICAQCPDSKIHTIDHQSTVRFTKYKVKTVDKLSSF